MAHRVVVFEGNIARLIQVGDGKRWIKRKADKIKRTAVMIAPIRSGRLKRSHRVDQNRDALGRFQTGFKISATAPHARYVHEGTTGPIRSRSGKMLKLPGRNPRRPARWRSAASTRVWSVKGQRANPWLEVAGRLHS